MNALELMVFAQPLPEHLLPTPVEAKPKVSRPREKRVFLPWQPCEPFYFLEYTHAELGGEYVRKCGYVKQAAALEVIGNRRAICPEKTWRIVDRQGVVIPS